PRRSRREVEPVDAECLHAEVAADEADGAARPLALELVHVDDAPAHLLLPRRLVSCREAVGEGAPQGLARDLELVARPPRLELDDPDLLAPVAVDAPVGLGLADLPQPALPPSQEAHRQREPTSGRRRIPSRGSAR